MMKNFVVSFLFLFSFHSIDDYRSLATYWLRSIDCVIHQLPASLWISILLAEEALLIRNDTVLPCQSSAIQRSSIFPLSARMS